MSRTEVILIRHGETKWNVEERLQGQKDSELTATGVRQAKALARRMQQEHFTHLYSSDTGRAFKTALAIAEVTGHTVLPDRRLREKSLGIFEGFTRAETQMRYPDLYEEAEKNLPDFVVPGGENTYQMVARTLEFLNEIAEKHTGERVAAVTHGAVLSSLFRTILKIPLDMPRRFHILNTSIHEIAKEDGEWWLVMLGDARHARFGLDEIE